MKLLSLLPILSIASALSSSVESGNGDISSQSSSASVIAPYANSTSSNTDPATITKPVTVTDYTTYCPEHTTVTITTCDDHKCNPTTITVEEPTTLTVTGTCVVPSPSTTEEPTTVTKPKTVTDYTTYCPEHTTVTITTCDDHKCNPTTITVEEPTTLTVTGTCIVPSVSNPGTTETAKPTTEPTTGPSPASGTTKPTTEPTTEPSPASGTTKPTTEPTTGPSPATSASSSHQETVAAASMPPSQQGAAIQLSPLPAFIASWAVVGAAIIW